MFFLFFSFVLFVLGGIFVGLLEDLCKIWESVWKRLESAWEVLYDFLMMQGRCWEDFCMTFVNVWKLLVDGQMIIVRC